MEETDAQMEVEELLLEECLALGSMDLVVQMEH